MIRSPCFARRELSLKDKYGSAPEDGFPSINVANLLVEKFDGEITLIEYSDTTGIVY